MADPMVAVRTAKASLEEEPMAKVQGELVPEGANKDTIEDALRAGVTKDALTETMRTGVSRPHLLAGVVRAGVELTEYENQRFTRAQLLEALAEKRLE